ncbi:MAG: hypothetical protein GC136_02890 [Alphaproteobacteria bacterium]|nr:hypothetical protein [Alphaproteobacteria bacterium]
MRAFTTAAFFFFFIIISAASYAARDEYRTCQQDSDCIVLEIGQCPGSYGSISKAKAAEFTAWKKKMSEMGGPKCMMVDVVPPTEAVCRDGLCDLKPDAKNCMMYEQSGACFRGCEEFSPTGGCLKYCSSVKVTRCPWETVPPAE